MAEKHLPATISPSALADLRARIESGTEAVWYSCAAWRTRKAEVLKLDHRECQRCGKIIRPNQRAIVHHVKHLRDRPDLALSIWDPDTGERQLITVCKDCHELEHPESLHQFAPTTAPATQERWD